MGEIFSKIVSAPLWEVILLMTSIYLLVVGGLRVFLRPAMVGGFDPLNIRVLLYAPAIIGFVLSPFLTGSASESYFVILAFMGVWLLIIRTAGKPRRIDLRDHMDTNFQCTLLFLAVVIIVANVVVNMIIPGKIPLLMEGGGMNSRFEATENNRYLVWLSFATTSMPGLIYSVTQSFRVRKFAGLAVVFQIVEGILFANKGSLVTIVFILLNSLFIARARGEHNRYKVTRRLLLRCMVVVAIIAPFYLSAIGAGSGSAAVNTLTVRLLGGFDQLIFVSQLNLLHHDGSGTLIKTGLFEYQLMPFFKAFLSSQYDYSSIGQFVLESVLGIRIEGRGAFPNSNLILETIFTSGRYLGALLFVLELSAFYWCRRIALRIPITPLSLVLVQIFVFDPFGLFASGQDWMNESVFAFGTIIVALGLSRLWSSFVGIVRDETAKARIAADIRAPANAREG